MGKRPWCFKCAMMAEADDALTPNDGESILPIVNSTYSLWGETLAAAYAGDICTLQLYSCRKRQLIIFSNEDIPASVEYPIRSQVWKMKNTQDALDWRDGLSNIQKLLLPYQQDGSLARDALSMSWFTMRRRSTTKAIAVSATQVCECIRTTRGISDGTSSFTKDELWRMEASSTFNLHAL